MSTEIHHGEILSHSQTSSYFMCLQHKSFEAQDFWKHYAKTRNCSYRAIPPFPAVFSTRSDNFYTIFIKFKSVVCELFQFGGV